MIWTRQMLTGSTRMNKKLQLVINRRIWMLKLKIYILTCGRRVVSVCLQIISKSKSIYSFLKIWCYIWGKISYEAKLHSNHYVCQSVELLSSTILAEYEVWRDNMQIVLLPDTNHHHHHTNKYLVARSS